MIDPLSSAPERSLLPCVSSSATFDGSCDNSTNNNTNNNNNRNKSKSKSKGGDSKLDADPYPYHPEHCLPSEAQRVYIDKTLLHIQSGNADACDVISSVRRFPRSLAVQSVAFERLKKLSSDKESAYAIGRVGGVVSTVAAMNNFPHDVALQRCCADVLDNLATDDEGNAASIDDAGGVSAVVSAMERHSNDAPLLRSCCSALASLARGSTENRIGMIAKGGGVQVLMAAVEKFPNDEAILRAAFHCLRELGYNPSAYQSATASKSKSISMSMSTPIGTPTNE